MDIRVALPVLLALTGTLTCRGKNAACSVFQLLSAKGVSASLSCAVVFGSTTVSDSCVFFFFKSSVLD